MSTTRHFPSAARTIHQFARAGSTKVSTGRTANNSNLYDMKGLSRHGLRSAITSATRYLFPRASPHLRSAFATSATCSVRRNHCAVASRIKCGCGGNNARPASPGHELEREPTGVGGSSYTSSQRPFIGGEVFNGKTTPVSDRRKGSRPYCRWQRWCRGVLAEDATGASVFPNLCLRGEALRSGRRDRGGLPSSPTTSMLQTNLPTDPCVHITAQPHLSMLTT